MITDLRASDRVQILIRPDLKKKLNVHMHKVKSLERSHFDFTVTGTPRAWGSVIIVQICLVLIFAMPSQQIMNVS